MFNRIMNDYGRAFMAAVGSIVLALMGTSFQAQGAEGKPAPDAAPVRYELQLDKVDENVQWVSVGFKAKLYNDSDKDMTIPLWGSMEYCNVYRFEIVGPDGKTLAGPVFDQFAKTQPALLIQQRPLPRDPDSPFVLVKAKSNVEYSFGLGSGGPFGGQIWYLQKKGEYTVRAELLNKYETFLNPRTNAVEKAQAPFLGSVKAQPVKFKIERNASEWGLNIGIGRGPGLMEISLPGVEEGLTLSGQVVDDQGKPIVGATLEITLDKDTGRPPGGAGGISGISHTRVGRERTGADGKFLIESLLPGADSFTLTATREGNYQKTITTVSMKDIMNKKELSITMPPGQVISGKVVDKNSKPIPGARVMGVSKPQVSEGPTVYTAADGSFMLEGGFGPSCSIYLKGFKRLNNASPQAGHENDGTWTLVLEPES